MAPLLVGAMAVPAWAGGPTPADAGGPAGGLASPEARRPVESARLSAELRKAVDDQRFADGLVDLLPPATSPADLLREDIGGGPWPMRPNDASVPNTRTPNVDAAVIELDGSGRPSAVANVLLSKDYPHGVVVPVDEDLGTTQVRWRRWNTEEWDAGSAGSEDVVPGREHAPLEMMSPYPASVLKLMVGFGILQQVDEGVLGLDDDLAYAPANTSCGEPGTMTIAEWFELMITVSDNRATCALLKKLHDLGEVDPLNATFADLGLGTLQVRGSNPATGGTWLGMNMSALDTARLLLVVSGASGELWRTPAGDPVTADLLSASSREFFTGHLADQGLNQALSTTNWCGRDYPAAGIPQRVPDRWIDPDDGTVTVAGRVFGQDVRPCNETAEVEFAHKTGLTNQAGGDAGIVRSLPGAGARQRSYIVVVYTNLGLRFADAHKPADPPGIHPVSYTEKIATLGRDIDLIMARRG
ncbi:serine hydrolase [Actinopolymorpha sp. B17G11]|uniref:serine hydrolase n=1 Tax=unclassified Actinopolymorpha TaxID=2627063 RepID=UPI0032D9866F